MKRHPFKLLPLFIILLLQTTDASVLEDYHRRTGIRFQLPTDLLPPIKQVSISVADNFRHFLGAPPPETDILITSGSNKTSTLLVSLSESPTLNELISKLSETLVNRSFLDAGLTPPAPYVTAWLNAATEFALTRQPKNGITFLPPNLIPVQKLVEQNKFPDIKRLLEEPVPPAHQPEYDLYSVHCWTVLELCLSDKHGRWKRFSQLLRELSSNNTPTEAIANLLNTEDLQRWYQSELPPLIRRSPVKLTARQVEKKLNELQIIHLRIASMNGNLREKTIHLKDLQQHLKKRTIRPDTLVQTCNDVLKLLLQSPPLLQPSLQNYLNILKSAANGSTFRLNAKLRKAKEEFEKAVEKSEKIEQAVSLFEEQIIPLEYRFPALFTVARELNRKKEISPSEVSRYLDAFEKALNNNNEISTAE